MNKVEILGYLPNEEVLFTLYHVTETPEVVKFAK